MIFPRFVGDDHVRFDLQTDRGIVRIESARQYGCIQIDTVAGKRVGPVCNRHMHCQEGAKLPSFPSALSVFTMPKAGEYYAETGSACYSFCCDLSGLTFSGDGRRLDDGSFQRIRLRLGIFGIAPLVVGTGFAFLRLRGIRSLIARLGVVIGFVFPIFMLWWNR
jgi:hypothetical protein